MAKVRVTVEIDETFFAWENVGDLLTYSIDLVEKGVFQSKDYLDISKRNGHDKVIVTGAQLVPHDQGIWKSI